MASHEYLRSLNQHYGRAGIGEAILTGLRAAGKNLDALTPEDLAPADQFHTRGREATLELARLAGLERGMRVLDVGGGLGGPARTLATEIGCHVTVVDLTEEFCRVGTELTACLRLGDPSLSSLRSPDAVHALLRARGLSPREWIDTTATSLAWFRERQAAMRQGGPPPPLGLHILLGQDMPTMFDNLVRNFTENRLAILEGVWEQGVTAPPR